MGHRTARKTGAAAARDYGHAELPARAHHGADLALGARQRDQQRLLAMRRECIALVRPQLLLLAQQAVGGQHRPERPRHFEAPRARRGGKGVLAGRFAHVTMLEPVLDPRPMRAAFQLAVEGGVTTLKYTA